MTSVLVYYAHPGHRHSQANRAMLNTAQGLTNVSVVDLYAEYPRHNINIDAEQQRLLTHDVVVFQFPLFWYSIPSLLKEWIDLVLEYGFAYGTDGDRLVGKTLMLALTAASSSDAYSSTGLHRYDLRTFLTPLQQTAHLCQMVFAPPYVLYGSLRAVEDERAAEHAAGYGKLLSAVRDDRVVLQNAEPHAVLTVDTLESLLGAST